MGSVELELSLAVMGFVGGWFMRKAWKVAAGEMALRRHRRSFKELQWRR